MRSDTQVQMITGIRAEIRLREARFDLITRILGCESDSARARLLDVDRKTIDRVREGRIGEEFIAKALAVLHLYADTLSELNISTKFEELFELVVEEPSLAAAAS